MSTVYVCYSLLGGLHACKQRAALTHTHTHTHTTHTHTLHSTHMCQLLLLYRNGIVANTVGGSLETYEIYLHIFISLTVVSQSFWSVCIAKELEFHSLALFRVGGSMPVVFSYFSEYFTPRKKGPLVIILASFWMLGQIYTALLAWALLSRPCAINAQIGSLTLRSWRVFVMLCTVPALSAALCFIFLPESPSWLYQVCQSINRSLLKCTLPIGTRAPHGPMLHCVYHGKWGSWLVGTTTAQFIVQYSVSYNDMSA